ncbi:MAG TPA: hypothetical protein VHP83_06815 [Aggregatilineaceae bacterium]|nr:hypothetical protein [Aggregatilineaceae bacterium]
MTRHAPQLTSKAILENVMSNAKKLGKKRVSKSGAALNRMTKIDQRG